MNAVRNLNLLRPEFVVSVGDLIEGYTDDNDVVRAECCGLFAESLQDCVRVGPAVLRAVRTQRALGGLDSDALHASATINEDALLSVQALNTTKEAIAYRLQIADHYAEITIPANSVQTVRVQL